MSGLMHGRVTDVDDKPTGQELPVAIDVTGKVKTTGGGGGGGGGGGAATIANGADVAQGSTTDAAVVTDAAGTVSGKLRGLVKWAFERMPAALGQGTMAQSLPVVLASNQSSIPVAATAAASEAHSGEVGGNLLIVSTEFTRPADTTAYAANDVVSNSTSSTTLIALANSARVSGGSGYITGILLTTDKKSITPRFRVHFFSTTGPTLSADNAAWQEKYADISKRIGYVDLPAMTTGADATNSDMSRSMDMTIRIPYVLAATTLYAVLETLDAFTPASAQKFTLAVAVDRN